MLIYEEGQGFTGSGAVSQDTLGYTFTCLLPGTTYHIFLRAVYREGMGPVMQIAVTTLPQNLESLSSGKAYWTCVLDLASLCVVLGLQAVYYCEKLYLPVSAMSTKKVIIWETS